MAKKISISGEIGWDYTAYSIKDSLRAAKGEDIDSPVLELEDFQIKLKSKFDQDRILRQRINPISILALPLIKSADFERKFGNILNGIPTIWADRDDQIFKNVLENADEYLENLPETSKKLSAKNLNFELRRTQYNNKLAYEILLQEQQRRKDANNNRKPKCNKNEN